MQFNLDKQKAPAWLQRARCAATLLISSNDINQRNMLRIADLGCGDKKLLKILKSTLENDFTYQGYDLCPQDNDIIGMDFRHSIPNDVFEVIFVLGVLEYIPDLTTLFLSLSHITSYLVVSYTISDSNAYYSSDLKKLGWVHHYSVAELETMFGKAGFLVDKSKRLDDNKIALWLLKVDRG